MMINCQFELFIYICQMEESNAQVPQRLGWDAGNQHQNVAYNRMPTQSEDLFHPLGGNTSTLHMG